MARREEDQHRPIPEGCSLSVPLGDALPELATRWRETRAPELAHRLVTLADAHASFFRPLPKKGPAIDRLIDRGDDRYVTVLLRAVTRGPEDAAAERLERIGTRFGLDPRMRVFLEEWRRTRPYGLVFEAAMDIVEHTAEGGVSTRRLTEADAAAIARGDALLGSVPKRRAALALLREVYRRPEDTAVRLVLADALMDLGDPWGELIAIQCARKDDAIAKAREQELLREHATTWLGRLAPWVHDQPPPVFERGFPSVLVTDQAPRATGIAEWGTVTSLATERGPMLLTASVLARAPLLRSCCLHLVLKGGTVPRLRPNASTRHLSLWIKGSDPDRTRLFAEWATTAPFPGLKSIELLSGYGVDIERAFSLLDGPFGAGVEEMGFGTSLDQVLPRVVVRIRAGVTVPTVHARHVHASLRFDRAERALTLTVTEPYVNMETAAQALADARLAKLRVEASSKAWPRVSADAWRARLPGVVIETVQT